MIMQKRVREALFVAALSLSANQAVADGFYFGVFGGMTSVDVSQDELDAVVEFDLGEVPDASTLDDSDKAWGLQVGYQWGSYFAAEVGYVNLGDILYEADIDTGLFVVTEDIQFESSGLTLAVLGLFPVSERFDIHGRAGVYFGDTRTRRRLLMDGESQASIEEDSSSQDLFAGVGGAWNINENYSLRIEFQRFFDVGDDDSGEADVDMFDVAVLFR